MRMVIFLNPLKGKSKAHFPYLSSERQRIDTMHFFFIYSIFSTFILNVLHFAQIQFILLTDSICISAPFQYWAVLCFSIHMQKSFHLITQLAGSGACLGVLIQYDSISSGFWIHSL